VFTVIRLCLSVLVPADQRRTALAMDSVGVEVSFMIGPAAGVLAATQLGGTAALLLLAGGQLAVGLSLIALNPPTRAATVAEPPAAGTAAGRRLHWYTPALIAVLGIAAAGTLVLGGTDVGVVALLRAHGALSLTGLVFVAWGGGSILGGLVYGAAREPPQPVVLLFWLALLTVPVGLAPNPLLLTLTILPAAALCAPVITATADAVSRLVPEEVRGEALGWHGAALTVGQAAGAPLSGAVIDASAPWAGFAAVGALGGLLAVIALWLQRGRQQGRRPVPTRIMISQDAAEP
jgi:predicted MFS family arabinose efflux permease